MAAANSTIITVYGSDDGQVNDHARKSFGELTEGTNEFSHEIIDGSATDADTAALICRQVIEALETMPMFGGRKVVWLKGATFLGDSVTGRAEATTQALQSLASLLERGLADDVCLLISATEFDKRRTFNKLLAKKGTDVEYRRPDISQDGWESQVADLANKTAREQGVQFEPPALDLFIHLVSESSRQIASEVAKLALYISPERQVISEQDVRDLVPVTRSGIVFEISRAIENGQAAQTIRLMDAQLDSGEQPVGIIRAAVIPTLRNLVAAKILSSEYDLNTFNYKSFTSQLESLPGHARGLIPLKKDGTPNVYPLFLASQKSKRFKLNDLKKALKECFSADRLLVSSSIDARLVLHRLAICLAS